MKKFEAEERYEICLRINSKEVVGYATPRMLLSDFLRDEIGLTGTHVGCEHGVCGTCTICIDGHATRSCLIFALQANGCHLETVEGLSEEDGSLSPLQSAFQRCHGLQCGYCTPGILMTFKDFLARKPHPDEEEIRAVLSGHLCRCTGYSGIIAAIQEFMKESLGKDNRE